MKILLGWFVMLSLLGGCGTRLFKADFNSDSIGNLPDTAPPGNPVGDEIKFTVNKAHPPQLEVIDSVPLGSRALAYKRTYPLAYQRFLWFLGVEASVDSTGYHAFWRGYSTKDSADTGLSVSLTSGHFVNAVTLVLKNGSFFIRTFNDGDINEELLGNYNANSVHTILINVDKSDSTYDLTILQTDNPDIFISNRPLENLSFLNSRKLFLNFFYLQDPSTGTDPDTYVIDEALITERFPEDEEKLE